MFRQHASSFQTGSYILHDAPQVLAHLERDVNFPEVFATALRAIVDNEDECRRRFNSMAHSYLVGEMSDSDKENVDNVLMNFIGFSLATIINTTEHNLEQHTSATTVELPVQ